MYKITIPTVVTNGHFNKEKTLHEVKRCGAERIALAVERERYYPFMTEKTTAFLKELITYYHENGLEVLIWLGESLGHNADPVKPGSHSPYQHMRYFELGDISTYCPLDDKFQADFCEWIKQIALCGPDIIMLDDDFRMGCRNWIYTGCCCDLHMARLEQELEEKLDEQELQRLIFQGGKNKYRDAWRKVQSEGMYAMGRQIRRKLDEVAPEIRFGICCSLAWDVNGWDMAEMAKILAGNTRPLIRVAGGPYAIQWSGFMVYAEIMEMSRTIQSWYKDEDIEIISEGDVYPRPRHTIPAAYLECFDMIQRANGGTEGILKYVLDYISDADYETGYVDASVRNEKIYKDIHRMFEGKTCTGVRLYNVKELFECTEYDPDDPMVLSKCGEEWMFRSSRFAAMNSLPTCYEPGYVNILFGESARHITPEELMDGNVIDLKAARILMSRGIDVGISAIKDFPEYDAKGLADTPSEYYPDEDTYVRLTPGVKVRVLEHKEGAVVLTKYKEGELTVDCTFLYENKDGQKFMVFPVEAEESSRHTGWFDTYARRRQMVKVLEWMGKPLPVSIDGNYPYLYQMIKENEDSVSVGLWNLFADPVYDCRLRTGLNMKEIEFVNCQGHLEGDAIIIDSKICPYEFAGFEIKLAGDESDL